MRGIMVNNIYPDLSEDHPTYIEAPNTSGGIHGTLIQYIKRHYQPGDSLLLAGENENVIPIFRYYLPELGTIDNLGYSGDRDCEYFDLNLIRGFTPTYNICFSQAVLEHVCMPNNVIQNLADYTLEDGYIVLHTHNQCRPYHPYPIDCLRFFMDFFVDLQNYLPIVLIEYREWSWAQEIADHIGVLYKKIAQ